MKNNSYERGFKFPHNHISVNSGGKKKKKKQYSASSFKADHKRKKSAKNV